MKSNYKRLGNYIARCDEFNDGMMVTELLGISNNKYFQKSHTNTIGIDLSTYRIVRDRQFAFNRATTRNGDKISIALRDGADCIVSPSYRIFKVKDEKALNSEYLMMWFRRPEFDRYARFKSHGSAHEFFDWEEMCEVELPIPHIDKQREIVKEYNAIVNRIKLNEQLCQKLEETAQAIYKQWFVDFEFPDENGKPYKSNGGEMVFNNELEKEVPKGWKITRLDQLCKIKGGKRLPKGKSLNNQKNGNRYIKVADMSESKFIILNDLFEYVDFETQKGISRYICNTGDLLISIVGTVGLVNIVDDTLNEANLTENCVKLSELQSNLRDYIYHYLVSETGKRIIEEKTVGGVQGKLPLYNIQSIGILIPDQKCLSTFYKNIQILNSQLLNSKKEKDLLNIIKELLHSKLATIET